MKQEKTKCAHPACNCIVDEGTAYCSQYCKDAGKSLEISCNCGHAGCAISVSMPVMTGVPG